MSKIHVLEQDDTRYRVAIHFPIATGNNSAGLSWKDCAVAGKYIGSTVLEVGTLPGNITQAEYDSIIAGDTIEIIRTIAPGITASIAAVELLCNILISEYNANMVNTLMYYGYTIG